MYKEIFLEIPASASKARHRLRNNDGAMLFCSFYLQYNIICIHLPIKDLKGAIGIKIYCTKTDTQGTGPIFCRRLSSPRPPLFGNPIFPLSTQMIDMFGHVHFSQVMHE